MPARVSAVIPTKNVAGITRPTLGSLRFCDEAVIVDMFSTDGTRAVCEPTEPSKFHRRRDCIYGNFKLRTQQVSGDSILRIVIDEMVSPRLRWWIQEVLAEHKRRAQYAMPCPVSTSCECGTHGLYLRQNDEGVFTRFPHWNRSH